MKQGINEREITLEYSKGFKDGLEQAKRLFSFYMEGGLDSLQKQIDDYKEAIAKEIKKTK